MFLKEALKFASQNELESLAKHLEKCNSTDIFNGLNKFTNDVRRFNYCQYSDDFLEDLKEEGTITGNRVMVVNEDGHYRFIVDIDDFGHVLAALNRLVQKFIPGFQFPK